VDVGFLINWMMHFYFYDCLYNRLLCICCNVMFHDLINKDTKLQTVLGKQKYSLGKFTTTVYMIIISPIHGCTVQLFKYSKN
jgi:hypothetical protein